MTSVVPSSGRTSIAADAWHVRLLGAAAVSRADEQRMQFGARSVLLLLARLAIHPQRQHAREGLIELLWPGVAIDAGRNRLRQTLFSLRQILEPIGAASGPVLDADRVGVRVVAGRLESDVARFEAALREGRSAAALALYGGELLPGFYDDWVVEERHRLAALAERAQEAVAAGVDPPGAREVEAMAPAPPRAALPDRAERRPHRLPTYLTRFFGRESERSALRHEVSTHRLVTLQGAGGSGKTRLAVELAAAFAAAPDTGFALVAFAPLAGCTTRDHLLAALVATLGLHAADEDLVGALVAGLDGRRALLVLDNFEQLLGEGALLVAQLTSALPDLHLIVTSRRALGVDGERTFAIDALELPRRGEAIAAAAVRPAVALFVDRARGARADFAVRPGNLGPIIDLVLLLEGMPLAIELAAARVRSMTPAQMADLLRAARAGNGAPAALPLLARSGPRAGSDPRHASMQSVIAWSWQLLAPREATTLAGSTVFHGGFSAAAAAAVCLDGVDGASVVLALDELVGDSLLRATPFGDAAVRYGSLEPVREYAAARLSGADAARLRERHRAWCTAWARALPATPSLAEVRIEMRNVLAGLASAVADGVPDAAVRLALPLRRALEDVELPADGLASLESAVARCTDATLQAQGCVLLGPLLFLAGRSDAAQAAARAGLEHSPPGSPWRGRALHAMARVRWRHSRLLDPELAAWVDEAAALADRAGDVELQASVLALRGFIANGQRDHLRGEALHRQALGLWEQLGNRHAIHSGRYNLAVCAQNAGRHREALERLAGIEPDARALHDWRRLSQLLNVRGKAFSELRAWPEAVVAFRECIQLAWDGMAMHELAYGLWNLPRALAHVRQPEAALRIAAFAAAFWQSRFGALSPGDQHDLRRVRRLCARQLDSRRCDASWVAGTGMTPAEAVASLSSLSD